MLLDLDPVLFGDFLEVDLFLLDLFSEDLELQSLLSLLRVTGVEIPFDSTVAVELETVEVEASVSALTNDTKASSGSLSISPSESSSNVPEATLEEVDPSWTSDAFGF